MIDWKPLLIYLTINAFTPGPNNILTMSIAAKHGFWKSVPYDLGVFFGCMAVMPISTIFTSLVFQAIPKVKIIMQIVGAAYMIYLAYKVWRGGSDVKVKKTENDIGFLSGVVLQLINPKLYIYTITAMSIFVLPVYSSISMLFLFVILFAFLGFLGTVAWSLFGSALCQMFVKHAKIMNSILALLLLYCAVSLFL